MDTNDARGGGAGGRAADSPVGWAGAPGLDPADQSEADAIEGERLQRFFPALLGLTVLFTSAEAALAAVLREPALAASAGATGVFAVGIIVAGLEVRTGHPVRARIALAVSLTLFGALAARLVPDVGPAVAFLPILSVVLVLPHVPRHMVFPLVIAAIAAVTLILLLGETAHHLPEMAVPIGIVFRDSILVGVVILVLAGLADFAMEARDALLDLRTSSKRQQEITAARLATVASLRTLEAQPTPEATAALIATALADLPLADFALILEATDDGLCLLAAAGGDLGPIQLTDEVPAARAAYLLERSKAGAWAELWVDPPEEGLYDELTDLGIKGQATAPILIGDETVALISIATTDATQALHLVADLPSINESASVAAAILAPALLARHQLRRSKELITETIASGAFHVVFQPIVDLATARTVGFEALTRFAASETPNQIFADAARVGLGAELETATLAAAIRDAARLPVGAWLSLNVSPALLAEHDILSGLLAHRTRPIVLEITEHETIYDYAILHAAVRKLGPDVRLAVDDAGAGVANFGHLVELRPDMVKIDASLIRGVNADVSRQALIAGLVHFAVVAGVRLLAEGVETAAEQETVQRLGVTLGQGFRLGRPAPVDAWVLPGHTGEDTLSMGTVVPMIRRRIGPG